MSAVDLTLLRWALGCPFVSGPRTGDRNWLCTAPGGRADRAMAAHAARGFAEFVRAGNFPADDAGPGRRYRLWRVTEAGRAAALAKPAAAA